ncbi:hypothetical protein ACQJBY_011211 [Aegilops geniculata]
MNCVLVIRHAYPISFTWPAEIFLDVADDGDGDVVADGDVDAAQGDRDQDADALTGERKTITKTVTRVELNKRARRKTEADAKKLEVLSKQIDSLPNILEEIAASTKDSSHSHVVWVDTSLHIF